MRQRKMLRNAVLAVAAILGIVLAVFLGGEVLRNLRLLDTAASDNVQWTLSQVEVEFLELDLAIKAHAAGELDDLGVIRQEFDIFYSRIGTLSEGDLYRDLRTDPNFAGPLLAIRNFLMDGVTIIDAPDAEMIARLPEMSQEIEKLRIAVRTLSATGLSHFAAMADLRRQDISSTFAHLAIVTLAILTTLALVSIALFRLNRINVQRSHAIELSSRRMSTIVEASLDAIVVANRRGEIIEFNAAAEETFGYAKAEVIGRDMSEIIVPEQMREAHHAGMARYRETGEPRVIGQGRINLEAMRADGSVFPVEMSIQSAEGRDGEIFVGFLRDISHRVAAERELVEARDKAVAGEKAKSEFLAVMSHEMRTPLNGLLGTLAVLRDTRLTKRQTSYVDNIQISGDLLLTHINDVLDVTKYEAGALRIHPVPTELSALVQSVVDSQRDLASEAGNTIQWHWTGDPLPMVMTDPMRLSQVLINLVGNAVKFTQNGRISIDLIPETIDGVPELTILVADTGVGIEPHEIERMFEDFATGDSTYGRARNGTGLGLGIARRMAQALGGEVGAESTLGEGSTFWLKVPITLASERTLTEGPAKARAQKSPVLADPKNVLIIEDNEINRIVLRDMLRADGHKVSEAVDGVDGVGQAAARAFDLILTDISMPVLDGVAAAQIIREKPGPNQDTPIFAVTAHAMPEELERFTDAGMNGALSKPISRTNLRAVLADEDVRSLPAAESSTLLDEDQLRDFASDLDPKTFQRLVTKFRSDASRTLDALDQAADPAEIGRMSHKLAGSAALFGASELAASLRGIESHAAKGASCEALSLELTKVRDLWNRTETALAALANVI